MDISKEAEHEKNIGTTTDASPSENAICLVDPHVVSKFSETPTQNIYRDWLFCLYLLHSCFRSAIQKARDWKRANILRARLATMSSIFFFYHKRLWKISSYSPIDLPVNIVIDKGINVIVKGYNTFLYKYDPPHSVINMVHLHSSTWFTYLG